MPDHCTLKTRSGADCRAWAIPGTDRCSQHAAERLRPRLTPEVTDRLLVLLRNGDHVDIACEAAGIPRRTKPKRLPPQPNSCGMAPRFCFR